MSNTEEIDSCPLCQCKVFIITDVFNYVTDILPLFGTDPKVVTCFARCAYCRPEAINSYLCSAPIEEANRYSNGKVNPANYRKRSLRKTVE